MTVDTRPAPRLPLDTADYVAIKEAGLDAFITFEPGEEAYQTSLLQTLTPDYWPSAFSRGVYDKRLNMVYGDLLTAESVARPVLAEFAKSVPRPPQSGGG